MADTIKSFLFLLVYCLTLIEGKCASLKSNLAPVDSSKVFVKCENLLINTSRFRERAVLAGEVGD